MSENKTYNVKNRSAGSVVYAIPEIGIRREFAPGETKRISFEELEKLTFIPGGKYLMAQYLQIAEAEVNVELNIKTEPEYNMSEADVIELIKTGSLDAWLDALDFAPVGVMDLIKKLSVSVPLTDTQKIAALKKATGFDAAKAIEHDKADKEAEPAFVEKTPARRVQPAAEPGKPARRTSANYKIIEKTTEN